MKNPSGIWLFILLLCPATVAAQDIQIVPRDIDTFLERPSSFPQLPDIMGLTPRLRHRPNFETIIPDVGGPKFPDDKIVIIDNGCSEPIPSYCGFVSDPTKFPECMCRR